MRPVNLARNPFRNQRLPNLLFALAWIVLLGVTAAHALAVRRLLPARTSARQREVAALEAESARLRAEAARARTERVDPAALARWTVVKDLVDRRALSWTALFARLEGVLPDGVRLVSIAPTLRRGDILLDVSAEVRSPDEGWDFVQRLEQRPEFSSVYPTSEGGLGAFHYTMRYRPGPEAHP